MRTHWEELPAAVRRAVHERIGAVTSARSSDAGRNSDVAAAVRATGGDVFVKGVRHDDGRRVATQDREAAVAPHVEQVSPRLLWRAQTGGWDLLGFELVSGRAADYAPGSRDLPKVAATLNTLTQTRAPAENDVPMRRIEQRWAGYAEPAALEQLVGDTLCHTDLHPDNILVDHSGGRAAIVDWAWPTAGAPWIDPACVALWLVAEGHSPEQAEAWARTIPAWHTATETALDVFTLAASRLWAEIADADQAEWKRRLATAARRWAEVRSSR